MTLTKKQILEAKDAVKTEKVEVPEWGGTVRVKVMSGTEYDEYQQSLINMKTRNATLFNATAKLCAKTIVDDKGNRLFDDNEIIKLGGKSCAPLNRIADVAQRLNGITEEEMDNLVKNSESDQNADSTLD